MRRVLREPRRRQRILDAEGHKELATSVDQFLDRLARGRERLPVLASNAGREFEEALRAVFAEEKG